MDPKDIREIKAIIDLMKKHDLSVFEIEKEGFRLKLEKAPSAQSPAPAPPAVTVPPKAGSTASEAPPPAGLRIGLTVSRALGGAVDRNRIRRRMREAVRMTRPVSAPPIDVVINPNQTTTVTRSW